MFWNRRKREDEGAAVELDRAAALAKLWKFFRSRPKPESVAQVVVWSGSFREHSAVEDKLRGVAAFRRDSLMADDFERGSFDPVRATAAYLFPSVPFPAELEPRELMKWVASAGWIIRRLPYQDFRRERLNRESRANAELEMRRSQYNRRFRFLARVEAKTEALALSGIAIAAKSGLASSLPREVFDRDLATAAYATYMSARLGRRSLFTWGKQDRAFDKVAEAMLRVLSERTETQWLAIAMVDPSPDNIARLCEGDRVRLLVAAENQLRELATHLKKRARELGFDRKAMIVRKGMDSSTWNALAGAWNKVRMAWIELVHQTGAAPIFEDRLPGKVMRLMAGDVAMWRKSLGMGDDPEALAWSELPDPWKVLLGEAHCNRPLVEEVCKRHGVDPYKSGWIARAPERRPVEFRPTPDSLYGVVVPTGSAIGAYLKQVGAFSGKPGKMAGPGAGLLAELVRRDHVEYVNSGEAEKSPE